jgi:Purple acid Phosphatase, N-terminal domain
VELRRLGVVCLIAGAAAALSGSHPAVADDQHPVNASDEHARITDGPDVERTTDTWAVIRWTTSNVRGTSLRYGVVHYGTGPDALGQTAKSPNRWNPALPAMIFRVQINHLQPGTTYYYRVQSVDALNRTEGSESLVRVNQFTTEQPSRR